MNQESYLVGVFATLAAIAFVRGCVSAEDEPANLIGVLVGAIIWPLTLTYVCMSTLGVMARRVRHHLGGRR